MCYTSSRIFRSDQSKFLKRKLPPRQALKQMDNVQGPEVRVVSTTCPLVEEFITKTEPRHRPRASCEPFHQKELQDRQPTNCYQCHGMVPSELQCPDLLIPFSGLYLPHISCSLSPVHKLLWSHNRSSCNRSYPSHIARLTPVVLPSLVSHRSYHIAHLILLILQLLVTSLVSYCLSCNCSSHCSSHVARLIALNSSPIPSRVVGSCQQR